MIIHDDYECVFTTPADGKSYFCGYYDKNPLNRLGQLLVHCVDFDGRDVKHTDLCEIVIFDLETKEQRVVAKSSAFNWQQGARLQWFGKNILFNSYCKVGHRFFSTVINPDTKEIIKQYDHALYDVSDDLKYGVSIDFGLLNKHHPGYGYLRNIDKEYVYDTSLKILCLDTGKVIAQLNIDDVSQYSSDGMTACWFDHIKFAPGGEKFLFFISSLMNNGKSQQAVFVGDLKGNIINALPENKFYSHYAWKSDDDLIIWTRDEQTKGKRFYIKKFLTTLKKYLPFIVHLRFKRKLNAITHSVYKTSLLNFKVNEATVKYKILSAPMLAGNGHTTPISHNMYLNDTYEDCEGNRHVYIHDTANQETTKVASFRSRYNSCTYRCDLHPRYDREHGLIILDTNEDYKRNVTVLKKIK